MDEREKESEREKKPGEGWPKASNNEAYLWPTSLAHLLAKQLVTKPDPVARKHLSTARQIACARDKQLPSEMI